MILWSHIDISFREVHVSFELISFALKLKFFKNGYNHEEMTADAVDVDITMLDLEKMMCKILDLVAALGIIQQELDQRKKTVLQEKNEQLLHLKHHKNKDSLFLLNFQPLYKRPYLYY